MFCIPKYLLILCTITSVKAIGLEIDGLLNLGDNWSYEYRFQKSDAANDRPHQRAFEDADDAKVEDKNFQKDEKTKSTVDFKAIFQAEKEKADLRNKERAAEIDRMIAQKREREIARSRVEMPHPKEEKTERAVARQKEEKTERAVARQKEEKTEREVARQKEEISERELTRQKEETSERELTRQKEETSERELTHQKEAEKTAEQIELEKNHLLFAENIFRKEAKRLREEAQNPKMIQRIGLPRTEMHYIHNNKIARTFKTTATTTERSSSEEVDGNNKIGTKKTETIVRENKKKYKDTRYSSESRSSESRDSSETSAIVKHKTKDVKGLDADVSTSNQDSAENIISIDNYTTLAPLKKNKVTIKKSTKCENKTRTTPTTTKVTTVRTKDIFTNPHTVGNDSKIIEFVSHLFKQSLKIFGDIKETTDQDHIKAQINDLAASYHEKFKEYIKDTSGQLVKTRLGTQKVILNTIETSNRLLKRLLNFLINNMEKKGLLRHNAGTTNRLQKAIETEQQLELIRACKKFGICRSGPGVSAFILKILNILLKCDEGRFKQTVDAFTEIVKNTEFNDILDSGVEKTLKYIVARAEQAPVVILRAVVMILKNTLMSQNKPMIVSSYAARSNAVNSTLAFLEIIDLLDTEVPKTEVNLLEWHDTTKSLDQFATVFLF
ncbi:hypothetical protein PYW08_012170 [Mythimna loreyi]|uniref:Uncharacterized protein n=1 Tax=Mythimna loreyi TaxID=667449 RepID=A0ACC2Q1U5_9NEOP|nr:hypothetical protein PYW08_012170 [Mythimna loreyi]